MLVRKTPNLVVYWQDTRKLLTREERKDLEYNGIAVHVTPGEVLILDQMSGRNAVIRGVLDQRAPIDPSMLN